MQKQNDHNEPGECDLVRDNDSFRGFLYYLLRTIKKMPIPKLYVIMIPNHNAYAFAKLLFIYVVCSNMIAQYARNGIKGSTLTKPTSYPPNS